MCVLVCVRTRNGGYRPEYRSMVAVQIKAVLLLRDIDRYISEALYILTCDIFVIYIILIQLAD